MLHAAFGLLETGSAWGGSGTLDLSAGLARFMDQFWAQVTANRAPLTVSAFAAFGRFFGGKAGRGRARRKRNCGNGLGVAGRQRVGLPRRRLLPPRQRRKAWPCNGVMRPSFWAFGAMARRR